MIDNTFVIADTATAAKLNVIIYISKFDKSVHYIHQRYTKVDGVVVENWLDRNHNLLNVKPDVEDCYSIVGI